MARLRRWWDGLPLETIRAMQIRHPGKSLDEIAVWAIRRPGYDELFASLAQELEDRLGDRYRYWKWIIERPRVGPRLHLPPFEFERAFQKLVVASALEPAEAVDQSPGAPEEASRINGSEVGLASGPLPAKVSRRGRRNSSVSVLEANVAAEFYIADPAEYDDRDDGGAYAVHKLYAEDRDGAFVLSRTMVGHLIVAIREGWLSWDHVKNELRIPDEFRTRPGQFVIPRRKPAS